MRTASEVLRSLEMRIARLEKSSSMPAAWKTPAPANSSYVHWNEPERTEEQKDRIRKMREEHQEAEERSLEFRYQHGQELDLVKKMARKFTSDWELEPLRQRTGYSLSKTGEYKEDFQILLEYEPLSVIQEMLDVLQLKGKIQRTREYVQAVIKFDEVSLLVGVHEYHGAYMIAVYNY